jgi:hypothetical protein
VVSYIDVILGRQPVGQRVAIMGAGGIGFDVAELITHAGPSGATDIDVFAREWGIDFANHPRGGVTGVVPQVASSGRSVTLLQRKTDPVGKTLGRTTGWTHRATLARRGVRMVNGVEYLKVDDAGLHVRVSRRAAAAGSGHGDRLRRPAAAARPVRRTGGGGREGHAGGRRLRGVGAGRQARHRPGQPAGGGGVKRANPEIFQAFLALSHGPLKFQVQHPISELEVQHEGRSEIRTLEL